jgi:hypothetical protein
MLSLGARANLVAGIVLRPSRREEDLESQKAARVFAAAIGTYGASLWRGLGELTHFLTRITNPDVGR